jgi:hypothetical protein
MSVPPQATIPKHSKLDEAIRLHWGRCPVKLGYNLSKHSDYPEVIRDVCHSLDVRNEIVTLYLTTTSSLNIPKFYHWMLHSVT